MVKSTVGATAGMPQLWWKAPVDYIPQDVLRIRIKFCRNGSRTQPLIRNTDIKRKALYATTQCLEQVLDLATVS